MFGGIALGFAFALAAAVAIAYLTIENYGIENGPTFCDPQKNVFPIVLVLVSIVSLVGLMFGIRDVRNGQTFRAGLFLAAGLGTLLPAGSCATAVLWGSFTTSCPR